MTLNQANPQFDGFLEHVLIFQCLNNLWLDHPLDLVSIILENLNLFELLFIRLSPFLDLLPLHRQLSEVLFSGILDCIMGSWTPRKLDIPRNEVFGSVEADVGLFELILFMIDYGFV